MINKILQKHNNYRNYWYPDLKDETVYVNRDAKLDVESVTLENALRAKWRQYIPQGWYGFSLGSPCPAAWYSIIDEFLDYLVGLQNAGKISNFEIHQIKMKFGGLRFYVGYGCEDEELREHIQLQIDKVEETLFDEKLIY
jgi:hypothetical protein